MSFNNFSLPPGSHARLSPSTYSWLEYDEDKMDRVWYAGLAAQRGTELHELAARCIKLRVNLPDDESTLSRYVNDAIGWKMTPEVLLYYSENCFGTTDAISFRANILRIADYKSGVTKASMKQLLIYAALFCLEYGHKPFDIQITLLIYQNNDVQELAADPVEVSYIMDRIVTLDKRLKILKKETF